MIPLMCRWPCCHATIRRLANDGSHTWSKDSQVDNQFWVDAESIIDSSGNVVAWTQTQSGLTTYPNGMVQKYTPDGSLIWRYKFQQFISTPQESARVVCCAADASDNVYALIAPVLDGGGGAYSTIVKLNSSGIFQWSCNTKYVANWMRSDSSGNLTTIEHAYSSNAFQSLSGVGGNYPTYIVTYAAGSPATFSSAIQSQASFGLLNVFQPTSGNSSYGSFGQAAVQSGSIIGVTKIGVDTSKGTIQPVAGNARWNVTLTANNAKLTPGGAVGHTDNFGSFKLSMNGVASPPIPLNFIYDGIFSGTYTWHVDSFALITAISNWVQTLPIFQHNPGAGVGTLPLINGYGLAQSPVSGPPGVNDFINIGISFFITNAWIAYLTDVSGTATPKYPVTLNSASFSGGLVQSGFTGAYVQGAFKSATAVKVDMATGYVTWNIDTGSQFSQLKAVAIAPNSDVALGGIGNRTGGHSVDSLFVYSQGGGSPNAIWSNHDAMDGSNIPTVNAVAFDTGGNIYSASPLLGSTPATARAYNGSGTPLWTENHKDTLSGVVAGNSNTIYVSGKQA
ncbi:MAG: hypothetical protein KGL39_17075 [Patescibacteria group bacterium]|nr:hypothetical protein [Patescibacteria group bacterium]